jgi:hypothetical protein
MIDLQSNGNLLKHCLPEDARLIPVLTEFIKQPEALSQCVGQYANAASGWDIAITIATVFSTLAMIAAAVFAYKSAHASERTITEMQHGRLQNVRPILYHTAYTERLDIFWNPAEKLAPPFDASVMARNEKYQDLIFQLGNYGQAPALNLRATWEISFNAEDIARRLTCLKNVPAGVSVEVGKQEIKFIRKTPKAGSPNSTLRPCASRVEERYGACGPNSVLTRPFPQAVQSSLFIFALQAAETGMIGRPMEGTAHLTMAMPMKLTVTYDTALEKDMQQVFQFTVNLLISQFVTLEKPHGSLADATKWDELRVSGRLEATAA